MTALADYLANLGFGPSQLWVMAALGGPRERVTEVRADAVSEGFDHPVAVAVQVAGEGKPLSQASGLDDGVFDSDGVMTKRPMRALTLSALAPKPFERLWDIGGGSGSVGIEWLMSHPSTEAITVEPRADRFGLIAANAAALGVDRLRVVEGKAPEALADMPAPDAVFIGGGLSAALLDWLFGHVSAGTRLVANAVTLESEAVLIAAHRTRGGSLLRIELSEAAPLGSRTGWKAAYPVVQWSVVL
mgnify:FL=1